MISVIVYGRNDSHGYNLHKRVAMSLNCLAEVLTDPDDEILFTDYNTPDELPTFPEAIADTLTERARGMLRVFRVRPSQHARFAAASHLPVLEPIARNVALRRSNPRNRWVLATNSDIVVRVDDGASSLSAMAKGLEDCFGHTARFEMPESLWEGLSRSEPQAVMAEFGRLGGDLHLHDVATANENILFDCPGDFQLILREDLFAVDGFHEGMLLGWHIDSNIARRLFLHRGAPKSLLDRVACYHMDHTRQATLTHASERVENNIVAYVDSVERAELPRQRETWGLATDEVEEVRLADTSHGRALRMMRAAIGAPQQGRTFSAMTPEQYNDLSYAPRHVLPFVVDLLATVPEGRRIGVFAMSPAFPLLLQEAARASEGRMRLAASDSFPWLAQAGLETASEEEILQEADVLLFELSNPEAGGLAPHRRAPALIAAFERAVAIERSRAGRGEAPRRFICVNGIHNAFERPWREAVTFTHTPFSSRVRHGYVSPRQTKLPEHRKPDAVEIGAFLAAQRGEPLAPTREEGERWKVLVDALRGAGRTREDLWRAAQASEAQLRALLQAAPARRFLGLDEADAELLLEGLEGAPSLPSIPGVKLGAARSESLARFARVEDWQDPRFVRWIQRTLLGRERMHWFRRDPWIWERAAMLAAIEELVDVADRQPRALVLSIRSEVLATFLGGFGFAVDCGDPREFLEGWGSAVDWRPSLSRHDVIAPAAPGLFRATQQGSYDVVLAPDNVLLAEGLEAFPQMLAGAAERVAPGGVFLLAAFTRLTKGSGTLALPTDYATEDNLGMALEAGGPFQRIAPFDASLSPLTALRIGEPGDPYAPAAFIRADHGLEIAGLWAWRRTGPEPLDADRLVQALRPGQFALRPQRRREPVRLDTGRMLDRFELHAGAEASPLGIRVPAAAQGVAFAVATLSRLDPGACNLLLEARLRERRTPTEIVLRVEIEVEGKETVARDVSAGELAEGGVSTDFVATAGGKVVIRLSLEAPAPLEITEAVLD